MNPAELENGTEVYFRTGVDTVFKGIVIGREELQRHFSYGSYDDSDTLVRVDIDRTGHHTDDSLPEHMAPESYQNKASDDQIFRDAYTIDAEDQRYILTPDNLIEILE